MKKTVQKEIQFCDNCGKEAYITKCKRCGVEHCWDCCNKKGITYSEKVYLSGGGDSYYCFACDALLSQKESNPLHNALCAIHSLKNEETEFYSSFDTRKKAAEKHVQEILATQEAE